MDNRDNPVALYQWIFDRLAERGITNYDTSLSHTQTDFWVTGFEHRDELWDAFKDIYDRVFEAMPGIVDYIRNQPRITFVFPTCTKITHRGCGRASNEKNVYGYYDVVYSIIDRMLAPSIISAETSVFLTRPWCHHSDNEEDDRWMPPDFWFQLFEMREVLLSGAAILLPCRIDTNSWWTEVDSTYYFETPANAYAISLGGPANFTFDDKEAGPVSEWPSKSLVSHTRLPSQLDVLPSALVRWVRPKELSRLLEFREKHRSAFVQYQSALTGLIGESGKIGSKSLRDDFRHAYAEMDSKLQELERTLRLQGIRFTLGATCVGLSALSPEIIGHVLTAIFGTRTLWDGVELIAGWKHRRLRLKGHDFWFPWYWKEKVRSVFEI